MSRFIEHAEKKSTIIYTIIYIYKSAIHKILYIHDTSPTYSRVSENETLHIDRLEIFFFICYSRFSFHDLSSWCSLLNHTACNLFLSSFIPRGRQIDSLYINASGVFKGDIAFRWVCEIESVRLRILSSIPLD